MQDMNGREITVGSKVKHRRAMDIKDPRCMHWMGLSTFEVAEIREDLSIPIAILRNYSPKGINAFAGFNLEVVA